MARPRMPTNVHLLKGTEQKHPDRMRERENEPVPQGGVGPCPDILGPGVAEAWDYLVGCSAPGVLTSMDKVTLSLAASLLAKFWGAGLEFDAKYIARLQALLGSMGMTPADRSKVVVAKPAKSGNAFTKFRNA